MKTISITDTTHKKLKTLADRETLSMSNFLEHAIGYFDKTKLNPKTDVLSIKEEVQKLEKRVNQVIAFIRTFEKENLVPLYQEVKTVNLQSIETYNKLPKADQLKKISDNLQVLSHNMERMIDILNKKTGSLNTSIEGIESNIRKSTHEQTKDILLYLMNQGMTGSAKNRDSILSKYGLK